jgi:hypothetical protein
VWFSRYGTLRATVEAFVNRSTNGYYASELAEDRFEQLTCLSLHQCPHCQQGRMLVVETLPRLLCKSTPPMDSS